ncbi:MAG: hypothetical protein IKZ08_02655 [Bacteroidales bacterium]|nr:hypothetical protein [Bacteroidales bacterium]
MAEQVGEFAIGFTVAAALDAVVKPKNAVHKAITMVGATAIAFVVGRKFGKDFVEVCDKEFGVDLTDRIV